MTCTCFSGVLGGEDSSVLVLHGAAHWVLAGGVIVVVGDREFAGVAMMVIRDVEAVGRAIIPVGKTFDRTRGTVAGGVAVLHGEVGSCIVWRRWKTSGHNHSAIW
eukprot:CAMPEP_0178932326 /NCGR_PEP_ID=MMETSP0786-20121207/22524_1 /TAXON_ID=186022 /ORGANISM="Thalassionema frauenfeldii, Strain CCMP 1798" /LENGTH=104 /DNA_ID=CAMNT_0020609543 /DNA_START=98 /DNA_END=409 /DNA_ORIENTATION=-